jgi:hypothetical protein
MPDRDLLHIGRNKLRALVVVDAIDAVEDAVRADRLTATS